MTRLSREPDGDCGAARGQLARRRVKVDAIRLCNANSNTVDNLINGSGSSTTVTLNELIGPLNAGAHTSLFSDLAKAVPGDYPVAIVGDNGAMVGWAIFHLTGSLGGSTKQISGYFLPGINAPPLQIVQGGGAGTTQYGGWSVKLVK